MSDNLNNNHVDDFDETSNGQRAYETLVRFLEEDGWYPQKLSDNETYRTLFNGKSGTIECYTQIRIQQEQLLCYAVAPVRVPENLHAAAMEFLTRANYGLYIGNFEMSLNSGVVRFKSSIDFEGEPLTFNLIRNAIYPAVNLMDQYFPGLLKVIYGGVSAHDAITEIEG